MGFFLKLGAIFFKNQSSTTLNIVLVECLSYFHLPLLNLCITILSLGVSQRLLLPRSQIRVQVFQRHTHGGGICQVDAGEFIAMKLQTFKYHAQDIKSRIKTPLNHKWCVRYEMICWLGIDIAKCFLKTSLMECPRKEDNTKAIKKFLISFSHYEMMADIVVTHFSSLTITQPSLIMLPLLNERNMSL